MISCIKAIEQIKEDTKKNLNEILIRRSLQTTETTENIVVDTSIVRRVDSIG
jgi:hypothetical protein